MNDIISNQNQHVMSTQAQNEAHASWCHDREHNPSETHCRSQEWDGPGNLYLTTRGDEASETLSIVAELGHVGIKNAQDAALEMLRLSELASSSTGDGVGALIEVLGERLNTRRLHGTSRTQAEPA